MNTKVVALALLLLVVAASGCTAPAGAPSKETTIKSPQEASKAVTNISTELDRVSSTLDSIDKSLG